MCARRWWVTGFLAACIGSASAQVGETETITFDSPDRVATSIVREMYGKEFAHVAAKRLWLRPPSSEENDQIAIQLGDSEVCGESCQVGLLYFVDGAWAEIWRERGQTIGLGPINPDTGLKSVVHGNREWTWDGSAYVPGLLGEVPAYREPSEAERQIVTDWINENMVLAETAPPPSIDVADLDLKSGDEAVVFIQGTPYCGNGPCPVLLLDGDELMHSTLSLGPDVRVGMGERDIDGYRMVEVSTMETIAVISPKTGETAFEFQPEAITYAGDPR
ncbi:hypothetical protein VSX64_18050 [Aurantimonas sp. C2-6-R+9]|uniref:hypothetical protein n=1 Tax=unclassified Aurantimonas TaxID=2638230 RepID=UPI002E190795|nr:hypothetical protein [Aurantimonas sp. C2-6-R+9]